MRMSGGHLELGCACVTYNCVVQYQLPLTPRRRVSTDVGEIVQEVACMDRMTSQPE